MVIAKCQRCLGTAEGSSFDEASSKINHAVGLSRGIKCGDNWNQVTEVQDPRKTPKPKPKTPTPETPKE